MYRRLTTSCLAKSLSSMSLFSGILKLTKAEMMAIIAITITSSIRVKPRESMQNLPDVFEIILDKLKQRFKLALSVCSLVCGKQTTRVLQVKFDASSVQKAFTVPLFLYG